MNTQTLSKHDIITMLSAAFAFLAFCVSIISLGKLGVMETKRDTQSVVVKEIPAPTLAPTASPSASPVLPKKAVITVPAR